MTKNTIAYENKIKVCGEIILFRYIAFDTVNHEILLTKLKHNGIRGTSYKWFQSFLRERQQYTLIKESESLLKTISLGDPQDSVRGPLYLSYI